MRKHQSDRIELSVVAERDLEWARSMIVAAVEVNRATAPSVPPPDGDELVRRHRFHWDPFSNEKLGPAKVLRHGRGAQQRNTEEPSSGGFRAGEVTDFA